VSKITGLDMDTIAGLKAARSAVSGLSTSKSRWRAQMQGCETFTVGNKNQRPPKTGTGVSLCKAVRA